LQEEKKKPHKGYGAENHIGSEAFGGWKNQGMLEEKGGLGKGS